MVSHRCHGDVREFKIPLVWPLSQSSQLASFDYMKSTKSWKGSLGSRLPAAQIRTFQETTFVITVHRASYKVEEERMWFTWCLIPNIHMYGRGQRAIRLVPCQLEAQGHVAAPNL